MSYPEYYRARAEEAELKAREATLPNVREQYLKAARTWADMAARSERAELYRNEAARKAERRLAESSVQ